MLKQAANLNLLAGRQGKSTQITKSASKNQKLSIKNDSTKKTSSFAEIAVQIASLTAAVNGPRATAATDPSRTHPAIEGTLTGCRGKPEAIVKIPDKALKNCPVDGLAQLEPIAPEIAEIPIMGAVPEKEIKPLTPAVGEDKQLRSTGAKKAHETNNQSGHLKSEPQPVPADEVNSKEGGRYKNELNKDQSRFDLENRSNIAPTGTGNPAGAGEPIKPVEINPPPANANALDHCGLNQKQMDNLVDQMVQQIKLAPSSIEVELKPEILGKVNILVESREGTVSISIAAQNSETASMLNANLTSMRTSLEQQGINLHQMEVNLGYRENREQSSHTPDQGMRQLRSSEYPGAEPVGGELESIIKWRNQQGLNILA